LIPAGPDHAQIAAVSGVADYLDAVYNHHFTENVDPAEQGRRIHKMFRTYETKLLTPLLDWLRQRDDVTIVGPDNPELRAPTVSIIPEKKSIEDIFKVLTSRKLMVGYGNFYAVRPLIEMNIPIETGVLRLSFVHYTSGDEITQLIDGLGVALN